MKSITFICDLRFISVTSAFILLFIATPGFASRGKKEVLSRANATEPHVISLAGKWKFQFDPKDIGIDEAWFRKTDFDDTIQLPSTTDEQKKGTEEPHQKGRFTRIHAYRGAAWYQIEVDIPQQWKGKRVVFSMERTKLTHVWCDGKLIGSNNSLITTQQYELQISAQPGRHVITVRVKNDADKNVPIRNSHQNNDGTQTNWNGILGKIQLKATDDIRIERLAVCPDIDNKKASVQVVFGGELKKAFAGNRTTGNVIVNARSWNTEKPHRLPPVRIPLKDIDENGTFSFELEIGENMQLWSEFDPVLYRLSVEVEGKSAGKKFVDKREVDFGMRKFNTIGTSFAINGKKTFLRGKHDGAVFPHTGYPPMELDEWMRILGIIKSYGINHIRCHSWCPPASAFEACDRLGIYLLPELPHWGTIGNNPKIVEGDVELKSTSADNTVEYLVGEGYRMLDEFGSHASFVMLEVGNELNGNREIVDEMVAGFRRHDSHRLYAGGANNFLTEPLLSPMDNFWTTTMTGGTYGAGVYKDTKGIEVRASYPNHNEGHVNNRLVGTDYDFSSGIKNISVPVIGHETGQYQVYPDYREIDRFTGVTRAYNFETFRDRLRKAGMLDQADDFFKASGALAVICYREEFESAIRTPNFGGFQVLDLQDFPGQGTALVGILNSHLESKGLVTPEKWREFCNEVVPLLRHQSFTWTNDQTFTTRALIANYGAADINQPARWVMKDSKGKEIAQGELPLKKIAQGEITELGRISVDLKSVTAPQKLEVTLAIPGTEYRNSYNIWVYPDYAEIKVPASVKIFTSLNNEAKEALHKGDKILILPEKEVLPTSIDGAFQTDFWCYAMFNRYDPPGTMGMLCDPKHPALSVFPTEFHSNWQWWRLLKYGRPVNLATLPGDYRPLIQVIDNVTTNRKLGVLFEAKVGKGSLLVCSMNLQNLQEYPEARQMYHSLLKYMDSKQFNPQKTLNIGQIETIIKDKK